MYKMDDIRAEVVSFDNACVVATSGYKPRTTGTNTYFVKGSVLENWPQGTASVKWKWSGTAPKIADASYYSVGSKDSEGTFTVNSKQKLPTAVVSASGVDPTQYNNIWGDNETEVYGDDFFVWLSELALKET